MPGFLNPVSTGSGSEGCREKQEREDEARVYGTCVAVKKTGEKCMVFMPLQLLTVSSKKHVQNSGRLHQIHVHGQC